MRSMMLALLFLPVLAVSAFGAEAEAQTPQDASTAFEATASGLRQQLYAKQAELNSLMAGNQSQSPRVQELFTEIGGLEGQLYAAQSKQYSSLNGNGTPFRGGFGYGYCGGGYGGYSGYGNGGGCCR